MAKQHLESVRLQVHYHGTGPVKWSGGPGHFGVQDKTENLLLGEVGEDGSVKFDLSIEVKPEDTASPVFIGPFAHGPPGGRFLYLSWRNSEGNYAQRFKLPLGSITWNDVRSAWRTDQPIVGELVDRQPRITSTGANIGGSRPVAWKRPAP